MIERHVRIGIFKNINEYTHRTYAHDRMNNLKKYEIVNF